MHTILFAILAMLAMPRQTTPYQGRFEARNPSTGGVITLELSKKDTRVTGQYRESDNDASACTIEAQVSGGLLKGRMTSIASPQLNFAFTAKQEGNQLTFTLDDPLMAALMPTLNFTRVGTNNPTAKQPNNTEAKKTGPANPLVGTWVYSERYSSGEFWTVRREVMEFSASTITLFEPTILANDANTSVNIDPKGKSIGTFKYAVEGNRILVFHPETGAKIPFSTFSFYEGRLVTVTIEDKKRQIWERL